MDAENQQKYIKNLCHKWLKCDTKDEMSLQVTSRQRERERA